MTALLIYDPFDPADPANYSLGSLLGWSLGRFLDFETRRMLVARGSGTGGGSGRSRRPGAGSRIRIPAAQSAARQGVQLLRSTAQQTTAAAHAARREATKAAAVASYVGKVYQRDAAARISQTGRDIKEIARDLDRYAQQMEKQAKRDTAAARKLSSILRRSPSGRTAYEKRLVSTAARVLERRERRAEISRLSDQEAVTRAIRRLRAAFPNAENYDGAFAGLLHSPETARALLAVTESELWALANDPSGKPGSGVRFAARLRRMLAEEPREISSINLLFYHSSSLTDYGI